LSHSLETTAYLKKIQLNPKATSLIGEVECTIWKLHKFGEPCLLTKLLQRMQEVTIGSSVLTPKGFWLCFHQKHSKTTISSTSINFFLKIFLDTCNHRILQYAGLGRCGKNFRNFHYVDCKILAFEFTKVHFLTLWKSRQLHFTRSHLYEKMSKMVVHLWIHSSKQVGYILENF